MSFVRFRCFVTQHVSAQNFVTFSGSTARVLIQRKPMSILVTNIKTMVTY
jgi:hypothetical protein